MKSFKEFRARRRYIYEDLFSARALFITGLIIMPALLFNPSTGFRASQFIFFCFLSWLAGKKNNYIITISVILGIVGFNLIVPFGQVIFSIGIFRITSGALVMGIHRAVTVSGLIMLSRCTVRHDLKIPGLFGELLSESFRIFSDIMNRKHHITRKNFIADIDKLMLEISNDSGETPVSGTISRTKPAGFVILAVITLLSWLPLVYILLNRYSP